MLSNWLEVEPRELPELLEELLRLEPVLDEVVLEPLRTAELSLNRFVVPRNAPRLEDEVVDVC